MRGLEKTRMERGHTSGHRDSMKESAEGRFFENLNKKAFFVGNGPKHSRVHIRIRQDMQILAHNGHAQPFCKEIISPFHILLVHQCSIAPSKCYVKTSTTRFFVCSMCNVLMISNEFSESVLLQFIHSG